MNAPRRTVAAVIVALALALGGCTTSGVATQTAPAGGFAGGAPEPAAPDAGIPKEAGDATATTRQVERTAQVSLTIADPAKAAKDVRARAEAVGGFVASENIVTEQRDGLYLRSSTVTISVPSARLDETLDALAQLGTLTDRVVTAADVTAQVVDVEARIKTLRESIARIEQLMAKAGSVTEIARVEAELTSRQSQLESMLAQQKALADRVAMSSVTVILTPQVRVTDPNPLLQGLAAGWDALLVSLRVLITAFGAALPFAAIAAVVWLVVRAWLRRRRPKKADASAPVGDEHAASGQS